MSVDSSWMDPNSSWWAKANRANEHIASLRKHVDEFRASNPYSLMPEQTEEPGRLAYRLRYLSDPPVVISATIGDVLHNQRAALENLAFELSSRSHDGHLTSDQEKDSTFPICRSPDDFAKFAKSRRGQLYDARALAAIRSGQPFINLEEAHKRGIAREETFDQVFNWSDLHRLNELWNIDKHRRLTVMAWWPDLLSWGSNGETNRRAFRGDGTLAHNSVLLYVEGTDEGQGDEIRHKFNLALKDDPAYSTDGMGATKDVVALLEHFQWHLRVVFSCVFTTMSN